MTDPYVVYVTFPITLRQRSLIPSLLLLIVLIGHLFVIYSLLLVIRSRFVTVTLRFTKAIYVVVGGVVYITIYVPHILLIPGILLLPFGDTGVAILFYVVTICYLITLHTFTLVTFGSYVRRFTSVTAFR